MIAFDDSEPNKVGVMITSTLEKFQVALDGFLASDHYLIDHDVSERAITHKLAEHLQPLFTALSVDCEYNRNGHEPKRVNLPDQNDPASDKFKSTYPDIIVHERGTNNKNTLIIEAKKSSDTRVKGETYDRLKLEAYARELQYLVGVLIVFNTNVQSARPYRYECYFAGQWHTTN